MLTDVKKSGSKSNVCTVVQSIHIQTSHIVIFVFYCGVTLMGPKFEYRVKVAPLNSSMGERQIFSVRQNFDLCT